MSDSTTRQVESISYLEASRSALREELARDEDVFIMGEGITQGGDFKCLPSSDAFLEQFGEERIRDVPISELGFTGAGVGAAMTGTRPIVRIDWADFLGLPFEQLLNQAALLRYMFDGQLDMPFILHTLEGAGINAGAQHSKTMHTLFAHLAGLKVVAPGTPRSCKGALKHSIRSNDPVVFFENKILLSSSGEVPTDPDFTLPLGEAQVEQEGDDVTVVATQQLLQESFDVASELEGSISVEVIDPVSLYPLDTETIIESVSKTGRLVVADESPLSYGTHSEIITRVVENGFFSLDAPVQRVGVPDVPIPMSPPLEDEVLPTADDVRNAIHRVF